MPISNFNPYPLDVVIIQRDSTNGYYGEVHISGSDRIIYIDHFGNLNADDSASFYATYPPPQGGLIIGATYSITSSWSVSSSWAGQSFSSSFAKSSSWAPSSNQGSSTSSSWASSSISSSYALTASYSPQTNIYDIDGGHAASIYGAVMQSPINGGNA